MTNTRDGLWPYGLALALAAIPAIWVLCAAVFFVTGTYLHWPAPGSEGPLVYFSLVASAVPIFLLLLDYVAARGGVIGNKWLNVDFSKAIAEAGITTGDSFALPDNILAEQDRLSDSSETKMDETMRRATASEIVYLDLKDGNAWWVSRLLALCAGTQGMDLPKAIVFVGRKENKEKVFLGWSTPGPLLTAILNASPEYCLRFQNARMISRQLGIFGGQASLMPQFQFAQGAATPQSQPVTLHPNAIHHQRHYDANDSVMLAKITIDEFRKTGFSGDPPAISSPNLEEPPDRLTLIRLQELFAPYLYVDAIDRSWPNTQQLTRFLKSDAPYVALVRDGIYEGMLRSDLGERVIIRELFRQSQKESLKAPV